MKKINLLATCSVLGALMTGDALGFVGGAMNPEARELHNQIVNITFQLENEMPAQFKHQSQQIHRKYERKIHETKDAIENLERDLINLPMTMGLELKQLHREYEARARNLHRQLHQLQNQFDAINSHASMSNVADTMAEMLKK